MKLSSAVVINKFVSVYIGPAGLAMIGQFVNFIQIATTLASGAISTGVTKYVAEYSENRSKQEKLYQTASSITLAASVLISLTLIVNCKWIAFYFLEDQSKSYIIIIFSILLPLFVLNNYLLAIINGEKEIQKWSILNILQSVYSLVFTSMLVYYFQLTGALIAVASNQSIVFFLSLIILQNSKYIKILCRRPKLDLTMAKRLMGFSLMTLVTMLTVPASLIALRTYITTTINSDAAGYWQAIWYVSAMYMLGFSTIIKVYFLPRFSEITVKKELRSEIKDGLYFIIPLIILLFVLIFSLKEILTRTLFTNDFIPVVDLFFWQLFGDFFKIIAFIYGILLTAKSKHMNVVLINVIFSWTFVVLSIFLISQNKELEVVPVAHAINSILFLFITYILSKKLIYEK